MNTVVSMQSSSSPDKMLPSFFSKVGEQIADYSRQFMMKKNDLKLSIESLKENYKLLNAKASAVKDRIKGKKRKWEIEEWLTRVKSVEYEVFEMGTRVESEGFIRNLMDVGKVAKINEEVVMLVEQSQHFDEFLLDTCGTRGVEFLTTSMAGEAFANNVKIIWRLLETRKVSSIAIYGMGGVGKTALAKCINNQLLKQSQVRVFWIGASEGFTIKSLQDKIASFTCLNISDECDEEIRAARLHKALCQMKNIVLILDDLWKYIDLVKVGCPVSMENCRIVITTRSLEVCQQMCCQKVITVKTLREADAWKLFIESLAPGGNIELGPHEEAIAKSVAMMCCGLPLGIINVAESMRGKTSLHSWTLAFAELNECVTRLGGIGDVEVFRVLKYSFDRLNTQSEEFNSFQHCFMYCLFHPPGRILDREALVERFISCGLVDGGMSRIAQLHQGHSVLDKLVNVCLLEAGGRFVRMHGLVRGMALKVGVGKYMVKALDYSLKEIPPEEEWTECLEKVCLMESQIRIIRDGTSPNCPKLSTLLLHHNPLKAIPNSFFSQMKGLSTLDLGDTRITTLPDSVSDLTSLKVLFLGRCLELEKVPYLGKLKALRELNLCYTAIKEMPPGVEELSDLEFLSTEGVVKLEMLPRRLLFKLGHLWYLNLPLQLEVTAEEIKNLKEVVHLFGRLKDVFAFNCFIRNLQHDVVFQVTVGQHNSERVEPFGYYYRMVYLSECDLGGEEVLHGYFESLTIRECNGMRKILYDDLSPFHHPVFLRVLAIQRCKGIEYILPASRGSLSTLEVISLDALADFKGLILKWDVGAAPTPAVFSALRKLCISKCNKTRKLGLPASGVPHIEEITISECGEIEEVFEDEGEGGSVVLTKLKELRLEQLPELRMVCEAHMICNSIEAINIRRCPRLTKKMPVHLGVPLPPRLRMISVEKEWWESLEWENPSLPQLLKSSINVCLHVSVSS